jgi:hypothetical protein
VAVLVLAEAAEGQHAPLAEEAERRPGILAEAEVQRMALGPAAPSASGR